MVETITVYECDGCGRICVPEDGLAPRWCPYEHRRGQETANPPAPLAVIRKSEADELAQKFFEQERRVHFLESQVRRLEGKAPDESKNTPACFVCQGKGEVLVPVTVHRDEGFGEDTNPLRLPPRMTRIESHIRPCDVCNGKGFLLPKVTPVPDPPKNPTRASLHYDYYKVSWDPKIK